jgi:hypothetical protein
MEWDPRQRKRKIKKYVDQDGVARLEEPQTSAATRSRSKPSGELADQAKALRAEGHTVEEIAEMLDRSPRQVNRYLQKPRP